MNKSESIEDLKNQMDTIPEWKKVNSIEKSFFPDHEFLIREYKFKSDKTTSQFIFNVLEEAEKENHHPLLIFEWHKVTLSWSTHDQKSITDKDFRLAKLSDEIYSKIN
jgi:4a-hydroxytetrahydrobiopterin dehydratase